MKVTIFLDGRAGHEKQSQAIVHELGQLVDVEVTQVRLPSVTVVGRVVEFLRILLQSQKDDNGCPADTDLLIGTGSRTHLILLGYGKKIRKPVVTCMAPEPFLRPWFDLCCVPKHDGLRQAENIFLTDGPPVLWSPVVDRDPVKGLILVGGTDERSHIWDSQDVVANIQEIASHHLDIQWNVSTSPRTPDDTVELLRQVAAAQSNVAFFHFRDTPRGWVEEQYAESTYAWVTADSISMVYEAVTAGCKVGILPVQWHDSENKFQKSIDFLVERGLITMFDPACKTLLEDCDGGNFNEARRCAVEILGRFFPETTEASA